MRVDRDKDTGQIVYFYTKDAGPPVTLSRDDVLHIPGLGFDGLIGYSPIAMAKQAIGLSLATEEYGAAFFANGANPGGVLEHPGVVKNPEALRESWHGQYGGSGKAHKIAVLEEGLTFHAIGIPPETAQFLQTRKFQVTEIARIFRIPPHLIGDLEKSSFNNIEQQSLEFVKYTLDPWVVRWEQALMQALLLPGEKQELFIKFNLDGLLRGDYNSRMDGYATGRQNGWLSANDIRELEDMNRIPEDLGGDAFLVNGNMISITTAMQNTRPAPDITPAADDGKAQARRRKKRGGPE
jgi:HK97 family phage portal protein